MFSLATSLLINIRQFFLGARDEPSNYAQRMKEAKLGFALIACEDAIMLPVNFMAIFFQNEELNNTESIIDLTAVILSAAVEVTALLFKVSTGLSEVCCGNRGYQMNPEIIVDFIEREDLASNRKGYCSSIKDTFAYGHTH